MKTRVATYNFMKLKVWESFWCEKNVDGIFLGVLSLGTKTKMLGFSLPCTLGIANSSFLDSKPRANLATFMSAVTKAASFNSSCQIVGNFQISVMQNSQFFLSKSQTIRTDQCCSHLRIAWAAGPNNVVPSWAKLKAQTWKSNRFGRWFQQVDFPSYCDSKRVEFQFSSVELVRCYFGGILFWQSGCWVMRVHLSFGGPLYRSCLIIL